MLVTGEEQRALLSDFFLALAVCHTVIPERGMSTPRRRRGRSRRGLRGVSGDNKGASSGLEQHREQCYSSGVRTDCEESEDLTAAGVEAEEEKETRREIDKDECCEEEEEGSEGEGGGQEEGQEGQEGQEGREVKEGGEEEEGQPKLSASSPDDEALVS